MRSVCTRRRPAVTTWRRANGYSDWPWEREPVVIDDVKHPNVMRAFPDVQFYDYTKWPLRLRGELPGRLLPENYHLTFSLDERNEGAAFDALERGINVAVVFDTAKDDPLPDVYALEGASVWSLTATSTTCVFRIPLGSSSGCVPKEERSERRLGSYDPLSPDSRRRVSRKARRYRQTVRRATQPPPNQRYARASAVSAVAETARRSERSRWYSVSTPAANPGSR